MIATQQDVIDDFKLQVASCSSIDALVEVGASLFALTGLDTAVKECWPIFRRRADEIDSADQTKTVVVVDFPAVFWAAYSVGGEQCAYDVLRRIDELKAEVASAGADVIIAHDSSESKRREKFPAYKSSREEKPHEFISARESVVAFLEGAGQRVVIEDGWESDDVMASVAFRAKLRKQTCVICTDDRDIMQCCSSKSKVTCYSIRTHQWHSEQWLTAKYGVTCDQVVDWLSMSGKDDVPSIPKVGEKTASQWLQQYGSFLGVFDNRHVLSESKRKAVEEFCFSGNYWLARDLHTLNKRLPVKW